MEMNRRQFLGSAFAACCVGPTMGNVEEVSEFDKCKNDILYFVDNYLEVNDPLYGKLKMAPQQREYLKGISTTPDYFFCAKGRQIGISTANCVFAYWKTLFFGEKEHVWIVCCNRGMCKCTCDKYYTIGNTGVFVHPDQVFPSSIARVHFITPDGLRGIDWHDRNNTFILDEFEFWNDNWGDKETQRTLYSNLMNPLFVKDAPELFKKCACNFIVVSTPNYKNSFFNTLVNWYDKSRSLVLPSPTRGLKA